MEAKFKLDYADTISEFEKILKKFNLKRKIYRLLFNSRGLEFEQFRDFSEDEDAGAIDWAASSRANKLLARQYIEERDIDFFFAVDISKNMLFGSRNKLKAEYSADLTISLASLVLSSNDNAGLITFNEKIVNYLRPNNSKNQLFIIEKNLSDSKKYGHTADFNILFNFLFNTIKKRNTVVILISDFLYGLPELEKNLKMLSSKCEVIALAVRDPMDLELPHTKDLLVLSNSQGSNTMVIDSSISGAAYKRITEERIKKLRNIFKNTEVDLLELRTNESFVIPIVNFLQERSKGAEHGTVV